MGWCSSPSKKHNLEAPTLRFWFLSQELKKGIMKFASVAKKSVWDQACVRCITEWRSRDINLWSCEGEARVALETPRCWRGQNHGTFAQESYKTAWNQYKWTKILKKREMWRKFWHQDMKMQNLKLAQLVFSFALVRHFLPGLPFLHFRMVMYNLCHYMLEVWDLLYDFDFTWVKR